MGADRISQGPYSLAGNNPYDTEALVLDVQNNILETSGNNRVLAAAHTSLAVLPAQTALVTVTVAQALMTLLLNAGVLNKLKRTVLVSGSLIYTTPGTTTPVLTIALVVGGVTICSISTAALSATASTNMPVQFAFMLTVVSTGAAGTIESHGMVTANISANTPAAAGTQFSDTNIAVSGAVNLTNAASLVVNVSANSAISSIQLRQGIVEVLF